MAISGLLSMVGGVNKFDPVTETFTHYQHDPENPHSLSNNAVDRIFKDKRGNLWISTWFGGLNKFDPVTGIFTRYQPNIASDQGFLMAGAVIEDSGGNIWFISDLGLHRLDLQTGQITSFPLQFLALENLYEDDTGHLWVCMGQRTLLKFNPRTGQFSPLNGPSA